MEILILSLLVLTLQQWIRRHPSKLYSPLFWKEIACTVDLKQFYSSAKRNIIWKIEKRISSKQCLRLKQKPRDNYNCVQTTSMLDGDFFRHDIWWCVGQCVKSNVIFVGWNFCIRQMRVNYFRIMKPLAIFLISHDT